MKLPSKRSIAKLIGIPAIAIVTLGFASTAHAYGGSHYDRYQASPYGQRSYRAPYYQDRHEAQHDTNRNGLLEPWEHDSLHRHDSEVDRSRYRYEGPREVRRRVSRRARRPRAVVRWRLGW